MTDKKDDTSVEEIPETERETTHLSQTLSTLATAPDQGETTVEPPTLAAPVEPVLPPSSAGEMEAQPPVFHPQEPVYQQPGAYPQEPVYQQQGLPPQQPPMYDPQQQVYQQPVAPPPAYQQQPEGYQPPNYPQPPAPGGVPEGVPYYRPLENAQTPSGNVGLETGQSVLPLLQLQGVSKSYGHILAVNNAFLNVYSGRIVGLLGPNGSGKTTIIKMIAGLLTATSGQIFVDGNAPGKVTKSLISYLPERSYLDERMTALDAIKYFSDFYSDFEAPRALDMIGRLGVDPKMRFKSMSKGTKEKVQLVLVMSRRARLYLLDEPIGGVDPAARDYILSTILSNYRPNSTVILSTHLIHDIEPVLNDVIFINQGQIVLTSSVDEIRGKYGKSVDGLFREVFRC